MKYFVCSDVKSCYTEFIYALINNGFDFDNPTHKIVICGNLFYCGMEAESIIKFIKSHSDKVILIKGNKEDEIIKCIKRNNFKLEEYWNGIADLFHVLNNNGEGHCETLKEIAETSWLNQVLNRCLDYYETDKFIFTHGFVPLTKEGKYKHDWRKANKQEWQKARRYNCLEAIKNNIYERDKIIVCGHTKCRKTHEYFSTDLNDECYKKQNNNPLITNNIIAIYSDVWIAGKLNMLVLDDN